MNKISFFLSLFSSFCQRFILLRGRLNNFERQSTPIGEFRPTISAIFPLCIPSHFPARWSHSGKKKIEFDF